MAVFNLPFSLPVPLAQAQELSLVQIGWIVGLLIFGFALLIGAAIVITYFRWWIQSTLTGAKIGFMDLIGMSFRKVKAAVIVPSKIMVIQAGIRDPDLTTSALEAHYMAGGNVPLVTRALVAAHKAKNIELSFAKAAATKGPPLLQVSCAVQKPNTITY